MPMAPRLKKENAVLSVIDVQEKLVNVMEYKERLIAEVRRLIKAAALFDIPVVLTEQYPKGLGPTVPGILELLPDNAPIQKMAFSCCGEPGYLDAVAGTGRKQVLLCGIEAHVCVLQTALDLLERGYEVFVPENGVYSQKKHDWKAALHRMRSSGVVSTSVESAIFEMMGVAGTAEFKAMLKVIT